ncbi:hypothetical protein DLAC_00655 [Tieghemostelium lacteum]|uniref:Uncharacterized protein n=1 Tax=Tieghemostelium lacteum TaxID=361077 RepID=A0A152AAJ4_TIELA|nr:hypothetical protein DLAC_00655 [Tieghemostelium lacteum]|eukprot:KYR03155.1 hypothetical protein DLAC_00655 [Tieghemostelium lacteum]
MKIFNISINIVPSKKSSENLHHGVTFNTNTKDLNSSGNSNNVYSYDKDDSISKPPPSPLLHLKRAKTSTWGRYNNTQNKKLAKKYNSSLEFESIPDEETPVDQKTKFYTLSKDYFPSTLSKNSTLKQNFQNKNSNSMAEILIGCFDTYNPKKYPHTLVK